MVASLLEGPFFWREIALDALRKLGPQLDAGIVSKIVGCLNDERDSVKKNAIYVVAAAINGIGRTDRQLAEKFVLRITACLENRDPDVREAAVDALGELGTWLDSGTASRIESCLYDRNRYVARAAVHAVGNLGPLASTKAVSSIAQLLTHSDPNVHDAALYALSRIDHAVNTELLQSFLQSSFVETRNSAYRLLRTFHEKGNKLPLLHSMS
jgi:HEAT repeat protein